MKTPDTLKLTVSAQRNLFGKPTGNYTAQLGEFNCTDKTPEQAAAKLADHLGELYRHDMTRSYLITSDGTVFSLWHSFGCWGYDIIHTEHTGAHSPGSCLLTCNSFVDAYAAMKTHWEQMEADCVKH